MNPQLKGFEKKEAGIFIEVSVPNPITNSKHAKLLKGLKAAFTRGSDFTGDALLDAQDSPFFLAELYMRAIDANDGVGTKSYIISEELRKFPVKDFIRFGDKNCLKDVSRAWFSDSGISLDVQADIIQDLHCVYISTNDLIEHVMTYKPGQYMEPLAEEINSILATFQDRFGFKLNIPYAKFLIELGQEVQKPEEKLPF